MTEVFYFLYVYTLLCKKINLYKIYNVLILSGNKTDLINFSIEQNKKHSPIKSVYQYPDMAKASYISRYGS